MISLARWASSERNPIQMECSEEACVIMITLIFSMDKASNRRFENPGIPTIPLPSRLTRETLSI